MVKAVKYL